MIYESGQLRWIESSGGPLILLSSRDLAAWSGHNVQQVLGEPNVSATDYERACDIEDSIGTLPVADSEGIILGDEPMPTAWYPVSPTLGIFARWVYGEDQEQVLQYLENIDERIWQPSNISFAVGSEPLYLFDAVLPGADVAEYLAIYLYQGDYVFDIGTIRVGDQVELVVHRLRQIEPMSLNLKA